MLTVSLDKTKVDLKLAKIAEQVKDFREPFDEIGTDLLEYYGDVVFETQGVASGVAWRPLAPATLLMRKEHRGYYAQAAIEEGKILVWTGRLKHGFQKAVERTKLTISNPVEYFKYHQAGKGRPPRRKMLALNKDTLIIIRARMADFLRRIV